MNIAILSRGSQLYSTQSLYRAGFRRVHHMQVIDHQRCNLLIEKNIPQVYYEGSPLLAIDAVIPRIGASVTSYGAAVIKQFEMMDVFTSARSEALLQSRDKFRCLQRLFVCGLDVPKTFICRNVEDLPKLIDKLGGAPVIVKLLESTHGIGVVLAENKKTAISIVEAFSKTNQRVIVQEFIEEAKGADIRAFVVGGRVVAAMKRQATDGEFRSNLHRGATAFPVQLNEEEQRMVTKATRVMGLDVAGVDLLRSKRGMLVLEVNASPGLEGIEGTTGVNIAGAIIDFVARRCKKWSSYKFKSKARR